MGAMELAHPIAFSPATIKKILMKAGFEIIFMNLHGHPKHSSPLCKKYILVIAKFSGITADNIKSEKSQYTKLKV